jgi:uncharacterized Zn-finger protein
MEICKDRTTRRLWLSQHIDVEKVLERLSMNNAKPVSTPLVNHFKSSIIWCSKKDDEVKDMSKVPYANVVGVFNLCYGLYKTRFGTRS